MKRASLSTKVAEMLRATSLRRVKILRIKRRTNRSKGSPHQVETSTFGEVKRRVRVMTKRVNTIH